MSDYHLPVNIGNPDEISIKEVAEEVLDIVDATTSTLSYQGLPKDDPKVRRPQIDKANEILNWHPKVNRQDGLKITYEYFKNKLA
jgi:dTDP-glucose 4,6-dehydratase